MKFKVLLINPWIYDFSAYNFWARPLGLMKIAEYLSAFNIEINFIDCTDSFINKKYGSGKFRTEVIEKPNVLKDIPLFYKRYGISIDEFVKSLKDALPVDLILLTSIMSYWYLGVQKVVEIIRNLTKDVPIILGGIYPTLYYSHAEQYSGADYVYQGRLNDDLNQLFQKIGYKLQRQRDPIPYFRFNFYNNSFAPLLTSEGCPFRCSYCASNLLMGNYKRRHYEDVIKEVLELSERGIKDFAFYDDALLFDTDSHIKPLLREIIKEKINVRFHTPNGLHAIFLDEELAYLMKKANFKTIRLGLETVDPDIQRNTGGKVTSYDLKMAIHYLKKAGFTKTEIGVYLMYGIPGHGLDKIKEGIEFLKSLNVQIKLTEFSPIKGTKIWDELINRGVIKDEIDPLLTNNTVFPYLYANYQKDELEKIKLDVKEYNRLNS